MKVGGSMTVEEVKYEREVLKEKIVEMIVKDCSMTYKIEMTLEVLRAIDHLADLADKIVYGD